MKQHWIAAALFLVLFPAGAAGQRLEDLAARLARQSQELAESSYQSVFGRARATRADIEALYLTHQLDSGAALFERMASDGRPASELRDAAALLVEQARSASRYAVRGRQWDEIQRTLDSISRDLGRPGPGGPGLGGPGPGATEPDRITGRLTWRGRVDQEAHLLVRGAEVSAQTIAGGDVSGLAFQFTSPLPERSVNVRLLRTRGRGSVEIIQHPSRTNDFTAVVRIRDDKGGAGDYEFEMVW